MDSVKRTQMDNLVLRFDTDLFSYERSHGDAVSTFLHPASGIWAELYCQFYVPRRNNNSTLKNYHLPRVSLILSSVA